MRKTKAYCINSKLSEEAGIALASLKTEEGVLAALKKVKDMKLTVNGQPVIPLQLHGKTIMASHSNIFRKSFGAMPIDKDGKFRNIYMSPETKHAFEFLFKTAQGGYFDPGQLTMDNAAIEANLLAGRVFMFMGMPPNSNFEQLDFWVSPGRSCQIKGQNRCSLSGPNRGAAGCKRLFPIRPKNRKNWRNGSAL